MSLLGPTIIAALLLVGAEVNAAPLAQVPGAGGCVRQRGGADCTDGRALRHPSGIAVSPDGRHVYVVSARSNAITLFRRDRKTGAVTQLAGPDGCIRDGDAPGCLPGHALVDPTSVAISPDGRHVYVTSGGRGSGSNAIVAFARDRTTGALTYLPGTDGCVSVGGNDGPCVEGAVNVPWDLVVSPDGRHLYVTLRDRGVAVFERDARTGKVTALPSPEDIVYLGTGWEEPQGIDVSRDGKTVYVAADDSTAAYGPVRGLVVALARDPHSGVLTPLAGEVGCASAHPVPGCARGRGLFAAFDVVVPRDGRNVYVAAPNSGAIAVFARDRSGGLRQLAGGAGCVASSSDEGCVLATGLGVTTGLAVSPDGRNVYATSSDRGSIAVFRRLDDGRLVQDPRDPCVSSSREGPCAPAVGLAGASSLAASRDGRSLYAVAWDDDAITAFSRAAVPAR